MALFKISKGSKSNLSKQKTIEGYCWFTPEDGKFYIDIAGTAENPQTPVIGTNRICLNADKADQSLVSNKLAGTPNINGLTFNGSTSINNFAICETAEDDPEKVIELNDFELVDGACIRILFLETNLIDEPITLTITGTKSTGTSYSYKEALYKELVGINGVDIGITEETSWKSGDIIEFTWVESAQGFVRNAHFEYPYPVPICNTSSTAVAKFVSVQFSHKVGEKYYFPLLLKNNNIAKNSLTLVIRGIENNAYFSGSIYINGVRSSATNYELTAGMHLVYCDGTDFYFRTDGKLPGAMDYLPLSAGQEFPLTGPLGLTADVSYGTTLPSAGFEGQLFFLEEEEKPSLPVGGTEGQYLVKNSSTDGDASWKTLELPSLDYLPLAGGTLTGALTVSATTDATSTITGAVKISGGLGVAKNIYGNQVYGAVWNDYAEYRVCKENFIPGQVVCENGDDTLGISIQRLQPGANIVSDTFGFAIGETAEAKCPVAVSGRVLAYPAESTSIYSPGDPVCAGPNGTVSKMTREEVREYPDRIIGTVSAIPSYETWGENNVLVNGRIWIKVK